MGHVSLHSRGNYSAQKKETFCPVTGPGFPLIDNYPKLLDTSVYHSSLKYFLMVSIFLVGPFCLISSRTLIRMQKSVGPLSEKKISSPVSGRKVSFFIALYISMGLTFTLLYHDL